MGGQRWSTDDVDTLRKVFPRYGPAVTAKRLGRSLQATKLKAWDLNIVYEDNPRSWLPEELAVMRRDYSRVGPQIVAQALGRASTAVRQKAMELGLRVDNPSLWLNAHITYCRQRYPADGPRAVAKALGRTVSSVTSFAAQHNIRWINKDEWTKADDDFLAMNYSRLGGKRCAVELGRSLNAVQMRVHRANIAYEQDRHWTNESNQRLRQVFTNGLPADLEKEFFRDCRAIAAQARRLKVFRPERLGETRRLLDGTLLSAYWLGFLLADGHFGRGYIQCGLAAKDRDHLQKLARFFGDCRVHQTKGGFSIGVGDRIGVAEVMERFGIVERKTYHPPEPDRLASLGVDSLVAALIGFFDGDGCTDYRVQRGERRLAMGRIVCHGSWIDFFTWWNRVTCAHLSIETKAPFTKTRVYSNEIARTSSQAIWPIPVAMMRALKRFADRHELPVIERKWRFLADPTLWSRLATGRGMQIADRERRS